MSKSLKKRVSIKRLSSRILVVAVEGSCKDWSAYVGIVPGYKHSEEWEIVHKEGTKIWKDLAEFLFPEFSDLKWRP